MAKKLRRFQQRQINERNQRKKRRITLIGIPPAIEQRMTTQYNMWASGTVRLAPLPFSPNPLFPRPGPSIYDQFLRTGLPDDDLMDSMDELMSLATLPPSLLQGDMPQMDERVLKLFGDALDPS